VSTSPVHDCQDASSWDLAHVVAEAQIAFAFVPPTTGIIEVLIGAQSTIGKHQLRIEDEWEFSHAWCTQNSYLMMNVLHPNVPERLGRRCEGRIAKGERSANCEGRKKCELNVESTTAFFSPFAIRTCSQLVPASEPHVS
jgi:hypothetical protein